MRAALARWWPWGLAFASVVTAALVVGPATTDGPPLDPRSTAPQGAQAVVDVLEELGRDVSVATAPTPESVAFVVLADRLDSVSREALEAWVADGGRLIVADPGSPLLDELDVRGRAVTDVLGPIELTPACDDPELSDVGAVSSATWVAFDTAAGVGGCFPVEGGSWLVRRPVGAGELTALGGADAFTNRRFGDADNALLLVRLVGTGGAVTIADASPPGGGEATLGELVPDRVYLALAVLLLAFVVSAWAAGRRLGEPVEEPLPVRIPASELVIATADLMRRADVRTAAADALRTDLRQEAAARLGLPADAPVEVVAARLAAWSGADEDGVARALSRGPVADDDALVRVATTVSRLRRRLMGGALASPDTDEGVER